MGFGIRLLLSCVEVSWVCLADLAEACFEAEGSLGQPHGGDFAALYLVDLDENLIDCTTTCP